MVINLKDIFKAAKLTNKDKMSIIIDLLDDICLDTNDQYLEDLISKLDNKYLIEKD